MCGTSPLRGRETASLVLCCCSSTASLRGFFSSRLDEHIYIYPGQFDTVGKFAEPAKIRLKEDAEPHVDSPRKCNINMKPKIEAELKKMEDTGIIRKVREHTGVQASYTVRSTMEGDRSALTPKG